METCTKPRVYPRMWITSICTLKCEVVCDSDTNKNPTVIRGYQEHFKEPLYVIFTLSLHVESSLLFFKIYSNRLFTLSIFIKIIIILYYFFSFLIAFFFFFFFLFPHLFLQSHPWLHHHAKIGTNPCPDWDHRQTQAHIGKPRSRSAIREQISGSNDSSSREVLMNGFVQPKFTESKPHQTHFLVPYPSKIKTHLKLISNQNPSNPSQTRNWDRVRSTKIHLEVRVEEKISGSGEVMREIGGYGETVREIGERDWTEGRAEKEKKTKRDKEIMQKKKKKIK